PVYDYLVKVITSKVRIAVSRFYFEYTVAQFQNRDIKGTPSKVENGNFYILIQFVKPIGKSRSGRFVNDPFYIQACDLTRFFGCLALSIIEVSRNGNHCFVNFLPQIVFSRLLHFLKNEG